jgi:thiol-disulfide isomerase/thioredoxin
VTGLVVLVAAVVVAGLVALVLRRVNGRFRVKDTDEVLTPDDIGQPLGERATLLQFSSAFCAPCRATRVLLDDVAGGLDGVEHVEVDAESHIDLVRRLDVVRTPTVMVLDPRGAIVRRASGLPTRDQVLTALSS